MVSRSSPGNTDNPIGSAARALFAPWSFSQDAPRISRRAAIVLVGLHIGMAAALCVLLSTWTYLIGKGLILAAGEMDMGMDDLPADTVGQVAGSFAASFGIWVALLALTVGVAAVVADVVYGSDRRGFRIALRRTAALTIWFVVWAAAVFAINGVRHGEIRHPAAAVRAYAQLNQHGFSGSSAFGPGPVEREPLVARGRLRGLVVVFPLIWSLALPLPDGRPRLSRPMLILLAVLLSLVVWWGAWRLLPWTALETFAG